MNDGRVTRALAGAALVASLLFVPSGDAQTLLAFDGSASEAIEVAGPPGGTCGFPNGPIAASFSTVVAFDCATATAIAPPPSVFGDVAFHDSLDTVWVADGFRCTEYTAAGVPLNSFPLGGGVILPGPVTGLGWDADLGVLWFTNGSFAAAVFPPPAPGCGSSPSLAVAPFPLGTAGLVTDLAWDRTSLSLFVCDMTGTITNVMPTGAPGPFGAFSLPALGCTHAALQGIAIDHAASAQNGVPTLYVTDGLSGYYCLAGGAPAPATFYTPSFCFPMPAPVLGLALTHHGVAFGSGLDSTALPAPVIGSTGNALSPGPSFAVTIEGSVPGALATLFMSRAPLCPVLPVGGLPIHVSPAAALQLVGAGTTIDALGAGAQMVPIPAGMPTGRAFYFQWLAVTPTPSFQVTGGLRITIDAP